MVQSNTRRLTTCAKDSIHSEYSLNPLYSNGLSLITNRNILITFSFKRRAICRGANILLSIDKLSRGTTNFKEGH